MIDAAMDKTKMSFAGEAGYVFKMLPAAVVGKDM